MRGRTAGGPRAAVSRPHAGASRGAGRAAAALGLAAVVLAAASGCGVEPSGVIDVGEPATGMMLSNTVYFLDRGEPPKASGKKAEAQTLRAVARPSIAGVDPITSAVQQLLAGPTRAESQSLTTALPAGLPRPEVLYRGPRGAGDVVIRFPAGTPRLGGAALLQLSCTAALALRTELDRGAKARKEARQLPAPGTAGGAGPQQKDGPTGVVVESAGGAPMATPAACP